MGRVNVYLYGDAFSSLRPKERIWDASLADKILGLASDISYVKTTANANGFLHRNESNALRYKTVADFVERTGTEMGDIYNRTAEDILSYYGIGKETGVPEDNSCIPESAVKPEGMDVADKERVREAFETHNGSHNEQYQIPASQMDTLLEGNSEDYVYVCVDDVLVKRQKEERGPGRKRSSKFIGNTIITIQHDGRKYILSAKGMQDAFKQLMAFLLKNRLMENRMLVFITDGATEIKNFVQRYFGFRPYVLYLDWFHLEQKCYQYLSSALKCGKKVKEEKDRIGQELRGILWTGNTNGALKYIDSIDSALIKSQDHLKCLKGYIERKKEHIPCYAIREGLKLPNSSNPVEKANDIVVAKRQKGKGMAWSAEGSVALAAITVSGMNAERCNIIIEKRIRFSFAA